jgi:hypothetical protein
MTSIYYRPVTAVVRLEAVWTVRIAFARNAAKAMKAFLKLIEVSPKKKYEPWSNNRGGYEARLMRLTIEHSLDDENVLGSYPDW